MKVLEYETANPDQDIDQTAPPIAAFLPEPDPAHLGGAALSEDQDHDRSHVELIGDENGPSRSTGRPLSVSSSFGRLVLDQSILKQSPDERTANGRSRSTSSLPQDPHISALRGGREGPTYPPTKGAANYPSTTENAANAFDAASAVEAGEYEHHTARRT